MQDECKESLRRLEKFTTEYGERLDRADKEINFWRQKFLKETDQFLGLKEEVKNLVKAYLLFTPTETFIKSLNQKGFDTLIQQLIDAASEQKKNQ